MRQIREKIKTETVSWLLYLLIPVIIIALLNTYIVRLSVVRGSSMEPTYNDGDLVLIKLCDEEYAQGNIILFNVNSHDYNNVDVLKRIVAISGQTVVVDNFNNKVYVDGILLDEPYTQYNGLDGNISVNTYVVPENCYFVMGDNRDFSVDSRDAQIGFVKYDSIIGKVVTIFAE